MEEFYHILKQFTLSHKGAGSCGFTAIQTKQTNIRKMRAQKLNIATDKNKKIWYRNIESIRN